MEWQELLVDGFGRVLEVLERALPGVSPEMLSKQPSADTNSMGWLAWHLTRLQDHHVSDLMGEEQIYIKDGWYAKFGRPAQTQDIGSGHTPAQVAAFKSPDPEVFIDYYRAVFDRTVRYIRGLSLDDLDRELNEPQYTPLPTVGVRLISVLADDLQHAGQLAYVRGLLEGMGWQKF